MIDLLGDCLNIAHILLDIVLEKSALIHKCCLMSVLLFREYIQSYEEDETFSGRLFSFGFENLMTSHVHTLFEYFQLQQVHFVCGAANSHTYTQNYLKFNSFI